MTPIPSLYETEVYQKGLHYEKAPFTFQPLRWDPLATARMYADSTGYVVGSAGIGETVRKNRAAFEKWSIVPRQLVTTAGIPDLSINVLGG